LAGFVAFAIIAALVQARLLAGFDLAVTQAKQPLVNASLDSFGELLAMLVSTEVCLVYAAVLALLLWRAGVGRWSLATFAFLLLTPLEFAGKLLINQPPVPDEYYRGVYYPFETLVFQGTFPSGHAMRTAFFCAFVVLLLRARGSASLPLVSFAAALFTAACALSRVYLGYHWLSDVIAGAILGASLALVVAELVRSSRGDAGIGRILTQRRRDAE
jgi:undecaprenyl-diphosphatase